VWIENVEKVQAENEKIVSFDNWAMRYFSARCNDLSGIDNPNTRGSPASSPADR